MRFAGLHCQQLLNFFLIVDAAVADISCRRNVLNVLLHKDYTLSLGVLAYTHNPKAEDLPEAGPQV